MIIRNIVAAFVALACAPVAVLSCGCWTQTLTTLDFFGSTPDPNLTFQNNGKVRYNNIGRINGQIVDLLVESLMAETNFGEGTNTMSGQFGRIGLRTEYGQPNSGTGEFRFSFVRPGTENRVTAQSFTWYVWIFLLL